MIIFGNMWEFIQNNFFMLFSAALVFADVIVSATPTQRDDVALGYIRAIFNALFRNDKTKKTN